MWPISANIDFSSKRMIRWMFSRRSGRKKLLKQTREFIASDAFNIQTFSNTDLFIRLKPFLSSKCVNYFESAHHVVHLVIGKGSNFNVLENMLLKELAQLERKWRLI